MRVKLFILLFFLSSMSSAKVNIPKHQTYTSVQEKQTEKKIKQIDIAISDNKINLKHVPDTCRMHVFSIIGVKVMDLEIKKGDSEIQLNLPRGYYIVRINDVVRKIAIR